MFWLYVHSSMRICDYTFPSIRQQLIATMNIFYFVAKWPRYNLSAKCDRILSNIETLLNIGHQVSIFSADTAPEESLNDVSRMPVQVVHVNGSKIGQSLAGSGLKPDLMLFNSIQMEHMYSIFLYSKWNKCPRVLQIDRLQGVQQWRQQNFTPNPFFLHEYDAQAYPQQPDQRFTEAELGSITRSDYYFCGTDFIADYLARTIKAKNYIVNSIGVPINEFMAEVRDLQFREFRHRKHFAFIGNLTSPKNILMIDTLAKQIWPLIRQELKDAELHIFGAGYNKALQGRKKQLQKTGIFLRGFIEDTEQIQKYKAVLYPLQHACGSKGTISQSWFHHTPVVTTPIGAQGYFLQTTQPKFSALQNGQCYSGFFKERTFSKEELADQQKVKEYYASNKLSQSIRNLSFGGLCDSFSCGQFAANAVKIYTNEELWKECLTKSRKSLLKNQSQLQLQVNLGFGLSQVQLAAYETRRRKDYIEEWSRYLKSKQGYNRLHEKKHK